MQSTQLFVEVLLFILLLYVAFFKSYFTEKGKNLATTEDIGIITREVENVKSELKLVTEAHQSRHEEAKASAIRAYEALQVWYKECDRMHWKITPTLTEEIYQKTTDAIIPLSEEFIAAHSRLRLYIGDGTLHTAMDKAANVVSSLWGTADEYLFEYMYLFEQITELEAKIKEYDDKNLISLMHTAEMELKSKRESYKKGFEDDEKEMTALKEEFSKCDTILRQEIHQLISNPDYLNS